MSEFITLQVGQCGNQIGGSFWPLVLDEYCLKSSNDNAHSHQLSSEVLYSLDSFFYIPPNAPTVQTYADFKVSKIKAKAVLIDMEEGVIGRYKSGAFRDLFDDRFIITNTPGSGNNWAEGYYTHGKRYKNKILNAVRQIAERCDNLQGFLFMFSTGGGTGSGLGTYCLKLLEDYFPNIDRFVTCVYPTGTEDIIICPYNMALSTNQLIDHASCVFPAENRALLNILAAELKSNSLDSEKITNCITYEHMNNIIVNMLLHLTCGSRFAGPLNMDMSDISTNMVPFPKMHFLSSGITPTCKPKQKQISNFTSKMKEEIFQSAISKSNQLIKINPLGPQSVLFSAALQVRGEVTNTDMRKYVEKLQTKGNFKEWSRKSIKIGHCSIPPTNCKMAILSLFNTSAVADLFLHTDTLFKRLYNRKAHIHHYLQVPEFEQGYFEECNENLLNIAEMYKEVQSATSPQVPRLMGRTFV